MNRREDQEQDARKLDQDAGRQRANPIGSSHFVEFDFSTDASVGNYPQAELNSGEEFLLDDGGLYYDRFPELARGPIELKRNGRAKMTDVLSSSLRAEGLLLNKKAIQVFDDFELGKHQRYDALVRVSAKEELPYTYVFFANHVSFSDLDFVASRFHLEDRLGRPVQEVAIESPDDLDEKKKLAIRGKLEGSHRFYRIASNRIQLRKECYPASAIFGLRNLSQTKLMSADLHSALTTAGISGLSFSPNQRVFF